MKTFEINEELEDKLQHIADDLKLESIKDLITLGLHMVSLINTVEKEGGSLLIENNKGFKMPLRLKKQASLEENLIKELNKLRQSPSKKRKKKSTKSK